MFKSRYASTCMLAGVLLTAPACASSGYLSARVSYSAPDFERRAYQNGFDEGIRHGERDARDRRRPAFDRDGDYRDADRGYHRRDGDREVYRRSFREGYRAGYERGFGQNRYY